MILDNAGVMNPIQTYGQVTVNLLSITHYVYNHYSRCITIHVNSAAFQIDQEDIDRFKEDYAKIHYQQANNLNVLVDKLIEMIQFVPGGSEYAAAEMRFDLNRGKQKE